MTKSRNSRPLKLAILVTFALVLAIGMAEIVLRVLPARGPLGTLSYETIDGTPVADLQEGIRLGFITMVPAAQTPRPRGMFAPGHSFYLRYADRDELGRDWMDEQGRVLVRINRFGLRERDEITPQKPAGQRRILCLGDSFTFGWGVPEETGWVRLLEDSLRGDGTDVRTVNCGAAGTICVDEYWWGLQHRFAKFDPDAVIVTICLNDLVPCNGLFLQNPPPDTGIKSLDLVLRTFGRNELELDPAVDWVELLLGLPEGHAFYDNDKPFDSMWANGTPQRSLAAMKTWCGERKIKLMVVLWPFLQGLGPGRAYPFAKLHGLVAAECERLGIAFLDVLPALQATPQEELWVTPADMHANPRAMQLVMPLLVPFVQRNGM
ncbi:MAG: SGNH/GDSL hydrolase family protein [Planctomycetes bacterium]|nr:SGNH/GDSL hydrolase family protein [Planctomycetota bacterium]